MFQSLRCPNCGNQHVMLIKNPGHGSQGRYFAKCLGQTCSRNQKNMSEKRLILSWTNYEPEGDLNNET